MNYILVGFVIISFWININMGKGTVDLLPDVLGYLVIAKGIKQVFGTEEEGTKAVRNIEIVGIISAFLAIMQLLHMQYTMRRCYLICVILNGLGYLYTVFYIVAAVQVIEKEKQAFFAGGALMKQWLLLVFLTLGEVLSTLYSMYFCTTEICQVTKVIIASIMLLTLCIAKIRMVAFMKRKNRA